MTRYNKPRLLNKNYLDIVKNRLKSNRYSFLKFNFSLSGLNEFLKNNIIAILLILIFIFVCCWRYYMKNKGDLRDVKSKVEKVQQKKESSLLSALEKLKKKNRILNERRYAPGNSEKKITKITNLQLRRGDQVVNPTGVSSPKKRQLTPIFKKKTIVGKGIQTPQTINIQPVHLNMETTTLMAANYESNFGAAF